MLLTYGECLKKFGSKYNLKKQVAEGKIFRLEKGIYSDERYVPEYQIISKKYPNAIFTMNSAFYYHGLTDVIPEKYYLATDRAAAKIADPRAVQIFENSDGLKLGAEMVTYGNCEILMYNKERMLIELLRNKHKLPFDYYKEIIGNYRNQVYDMDIPLIQDMAMELPKTQMVMEILQTEVL